MKLRKRWVVAFIRHNKSSMSGTIKDSLLAEAMEDIEEFRVRMKAEIEKRFGQEP